MKRGVKKGYRPSDEAIHNMTVSQQNRGKSKNNTSGHSCLSMIGKDNTIYKVEVAGTYVGCSKDLDKALGMRDEARNRLLPERRRDAKG